MHHTIAYHGFRSVAAATSLHPWLPSVTPFGAMKMNGADSWVGAITDRRGADS